MNIPKIFIEKENGVEMKYRFKKVCNNNLFLYERIIEKNGQEKILYTECFTLHELGLLKEMIKP